MPKEVQRVLISYSDIIVGPEFNSRKEIGNLEGLMATINVHGLLNPLTVREGGPSRTEGKRKYFLLAGERRYRAIGKLIEQHGTSRFGQVEVKLRKDGADKALILNLIENLQREELKPLEKAQRMRLYIQTYNVSQSQLAEACGVSKAYVSQTLALLEKTAPEVQAAIENGTLTASQARELITLPEDDQRAALENVEEQQAEGKTVSVEDVKDDADRRKTELGIKRERGNGASNGKNVKEHEFDLEKVKIAKSAYEGQKTGLRSKNALFEQLGSLIEQLSGLKAADDTKKKILKAKLGVVEYALGIRDAI